VSLSLNIYDNDSSLLNRENADRGMPPPQRPAVCSRHRWLRFPAATAKLKEDDKTAID
jgi:hypothetical protein